MYLGCRTLAVGEARERMVDAEPWDEKDNFLYAQRRG
jgi:hypothetical protein